MKVAVTLEVRFDQLPDGSIWTLTNFHQSFWVRYLSAFDEVLIVARCRQVSSVPPHSRRVDRYPQIKFWPLPHYIGPYQFLLKKKAVKKSLNLVLKGSEAFILRIGSPIADLIIHELRKSGRPFGVEVVGDPYDTFAVGANTSKLRFFFRWWFTRKLKWETKYADVVSYVTSVRLPSRYPPLNAQKVIYASSIELLPEQILNQARNYQNKISFKLISIGALEDWRKGQDLAFHCLKELDRKGFKVSLIWIGDGRARPESEKLAKELGIDHLVEMKGQLPSGQAIFSALDEADIFIMPTRGEGLPRALIEAMARALPAVASNVGGIPELISEQFMHASEDVRSMTKIIEGLLTSPDKLNQASRENLQKSKDYLSSELQHKRADLYSTLRNITHEWQKNHSSR
jgi:glycosyltransferase involved in cell wall biosynthesis